MRDVLVFGCHWQLASELLPRFAAPPTYRTLSITRSEIDFGRLAAGRDLVQADRPWLVVDTAAYPTAAAGPRVCLFDCSAPVRDCDLPVTPWTPAFDETVGFMGELKGRHS